MSITNYQSMLCYIPEEQRPHLHCSRSLNHSTTNFNVKHSVEGKKPSIQIPHKEVPWIVRMMMTLDPYCLFMLHSHLF